MTDALSWVDEFFVGEQGPPGADGIDGEDGAGVGTGDISTDISAVVGINGVALTTADTLGDGEVWLKRGGGSTLRSGRPCPEGWFDPRDYGAAMNGNEEAATDDRAAFQAMLDDMPITGGHVHMSGFAWISDTVKISKAVHFHGIGGGGGQSSVFHSGFRCAPGKSAIRIYGADASDDGNTAALHNIGQLDIESQILVHASAGGSSIGRGIYLEASNTDVRLGDCRIAAAAANPDFYYRATAITAHAGRGPGVISGTPAWPLIAGATVTDNGITWTTEKFPVLHLEDHDYGLGDVVYAIADNRYLFTCSNDGHSDVSRPAGLAGGDTAGGLVLGDVITDGSVEWTVTTAAGVIAGAGNGQISDLHISGFTGPALYVAGGPGQYVEGGTSDVNGERISRVFAEYCGLGVYLVGDNCNGWMLDGLFAINLGMLQPTPNLALAADYQGLGGHCVHDRSEASGLLQNMYIQTSTGRPVLKTHTGRLAVVSCFSELLVPSINSSGMAWTIGGNVFWTTASQALVLDSQLYGRGIVESDNTGGSYLSATLSKQDGKGIYGFKARDVSADPDAWSLRYGDAVTPTGFWGLVHGVQANRCAYMLSDAESGSDPCPGWLSFPQGYFIGSTLATMLFRGARSAYIDQGLRAGARKVGDLFESSTSSLVCTSTGYKGSPWSAAEQVSAGYEPWGIPATIIEPTANTTAAAGGEQVWKCTTDGLTHASVQPTWIPGNSPITDGTAVWTYLGTTPSHVERLNDGTRPAVVVAAYAINWALADTFSKTLGAGAQVFTFSNAVDGQTIRVAVTGATSTLTWPTVKWPGGVSPVQTTAGLDIYTFTKVGSTIFGTVAQAMA